MRRKRKGERGRRVGKKKKMEGRGGEERGREERENEEERVAPWALGDGRLCLIGR